MKLNEPGESNQNALLNQISLEESSLKQVRQEGKQSETVSKLIKLGILYYDNKQFINARSCFEEALKIANSLDSQHAVISILYELALLESAEGNHSRAVELCTESAYLDLQLKQEPLIQLQLLAVLYQEEGEYKKAQELLDVLKNSCQARHELWQLSKCLNELGLVADHSEFIHDSVKYLTESFLIKRIIGDFKGMQISFQNLQRILLKEPTLLNDQAVISKLKRAGILRL